MQRHHLISLAYVARDFAIAVLFVYGYVYTAYKYGNPLFGRNDFFKYQAMIGSPFDLSATTAPFVLRQIPAIVAAGFYKLGLYYDTKAVVDLIGIDRDTKRRFLALIASNALAVCLSFAILCHYLRTKLPTFGIVELFGLFGIFSAWFYFPSGTVAPTTVGWGWFASSLFAIALLEQSLFLTCLACLIGMFSRETTLIFALVMVTAVLLFDGERSRNLVLSIVVLIAGCLAYLIFRKLFTAGYEHQISPRAIVTNLTALHVARDYIFQSILSQGLLLLLIIGIAVKSPRYAVYLCIAAAAMVVVAFAAQVSETALLSGETLPYFAVIFLLAQADRLPRPAASPSAA